VAAIPAQPSPGLTLLLGLLIALAALGTDMFLPSVPALARSFAAAPAEAHLSVTTYILGVALGQIGWGPASDRFGRKPMLAAGLLLFAVSSGAAALAESLRAVVALRFIQGAAMSSGPVIIRAMVRDLYAREHAAQLLSRMMIVFGLVPVLAPPLGALLLDQGDWRFMFWTYAAIALGLLLVLLLRLAETAPPERPRMSAARILGSYRVLLGDRRFVAPLATMLSVQMGIIAFVSNSSLVMIPVFGLTPMAFGALFSLVMLGHIAGSFAGSRLVHRAGMAGMVRIGIALVLGSGLLLALLSLAGASHWSAFVLPMLVYILGASFAMPSAMAAALTPFPQMAGAASSLLGVAPFALGSGVSAVLGFAFDGTTVPLALAIAFFALLAFLSEKLLFRGTSHGPG
jgi:DHA1 family bicyclomycin/chloramphenicol resistance-like MFS transporter